MFYKVLGLPGPPRLKNVISREGLWGEAAPTKAGLDRFVIWSSLTLVLLAVGDEDELCLEINIYLKRQIKTSGLWISSRTGHAINLEEPSAFNREVQNFFSTVERGNWFKRDKESIKDINTQ